MFTTSKAFRHPLSGVFGGDEFDVWQAVEVELRHPWFVLELSPPEEDVPDQQLVRTLLVSKVEVVISIAMTCNAAGGKLQSVALVLAPTRSQTEAWSIHPLRAVWQASEPWHSDVQAYILERQDGLLHVNSQFKTAEDQLVDRRRILDIGVARPPSRTSRRRASNS